MFKRKKFLIILSIVSVITVISGFMIGGSISAADATTSYVCPPANRVIYDLYATDGVWMMADGTPVYSYGFVGGREGEVIHPLNYDGTALGPFTVIQPTPGPVSAGFETDIQGHAQFPAPLIYAKVGDVVEVRLKNLGVTNLQVPNAVYPINPNVVPQTDPPTRYGPDLGITQTLPGSTTPELIGAINAPNDPHSIHLHALDVNVANDGVPETSVAAIPANGTDPGAGNVVVYMFSAKQEGTFFYHCHQEADIHVDMGMWGMLVIYGKTDAGAASVNGGPNHKGNIDGFVYDKDYLMFLTDTDVRQHLSEAVGNIPLDDGTVISLVTPGGTISTALPYNPVDYKPQYWFVNGLSFPETIHASGVNFPSFQTWLGAHPGYDPFIIGSARARSASGKFGEKILVRVVNMGFETQPMHVHGFHAKVLDKDQRAWSFANNPNTPTGQGMEINTLTIGSGEQYNLLFDMSTQTGGTTNYAPGSTPSSVYPSPSLTPDPGRGTETRYDQNGLPVSNTNLAATPISGVSVFFTPTPVTATSTPSFQTNSYIAGPPVPQLFVFHNHDDYKATNNGAYPGGQFTAIMVNP
jgi:manganese oxidase